MTKLVKIGDYWINKELLDHKIHLFHHFFEGKGTKIYFIDDIPTINLEGITPDEVAAIINGEKDNV